MVSLGERNRKVPLHFASSITGGAWAPKLKSSEATWVPYRILDPLIPKQQSSRKADVVEACADPVVQSKWERRKMLEKETVGRFSLIKRTRCRNMSWKPHFFKANIKETSFCLFSKTIFHRISPTKFPHPGIAYLCKQSLVINSQVPTVWNSWSFHSRANHISFLYHV